MLKGVTILEKQLTFEESFEYMRQNSTVWNFLQERESRKIFGHNQGRFTLWTMKSSHGRLSDVIGRLSRPGTTWVYTKEKMPK
jgi:hypothetical protein